MKTQEIYQAVTQKITDLLKSHQLKWNRPWINVGTSAQLAQNAISGNAYRGINQVLLGLTAWEREFASNQWLTYNQAQKLGGSVMKGEKGSMVIYHSTMYTDEDGNKVNTENMNEDQLSAFKKIHYYREYYLFNVFQTEGLPASYYVTPTPVEFPDVVKDEAAEALIMATGATIHHKPQNSAYYNRKEDAIYLPESKQFEGTEPYYETVLHELGHWTGHVSRLNRTFGANMADPDYAFEELVAELCAAFTCAKLGFSKTITNNASYIQGWLSILENDAKFIFRAAAKAQHAADFLFEGVDVKVTTPKDQIQE